VEDTIDTAPAPDLMTPKEIDAEDGAVRDWFADARLGLFIHWGLYSVAARHEWVRHRERLTDEEYSRYFRHFDPDLLDPATWAREAKNAGMRYVVLTTKHHEGFCLWDSKLTDYKAPNICGRDLVAELVDAFRAEGLHIGLYHSLIDWHHPEFPIDGLHPQRDDEVAKAAASARDVTKYADYLHGQVTELLTSYGRIDYLFFDYSYRDHVWGGKGPADWRSAELLDLVRDLQPGILVNDRLGIPGDFLTPEQYQPHASMTLGGRRVAWEACQTFNGSWGYDRDNTDWKSTDLLIRMLVDTVSKGGNLLLNVGPNGRGELEPRALDRLRGVGEWMRLHERSVYGCTDSSFVAPADCRYTQRGNRLYLHVFAWPFRHLHLPGVVGKVEYAQFLHDGSEIEMQVIESEQLAQNMTLGGLPAGTLTLVLPVQPPAVDVPVIELFLS